MHKCAASSAWQPSCTLCADVALCLGTILSVNGVDLHVDCCIMALFIRRVTHTSHVVICVGIVTQRNVLKPQGSRLS